MSWKSIACVAALGALTAPALALPSISVVDNGNGTGSLNVITTANGSIGAELTLVLSGATLGGATINSAIYDTANVGDNPFENGLPIGGDGEGLELDLANNRLYASFGSGIQTAGTYKLLDFTYTGSGTATGDGFVGSVGALTNVAGVTIDIGGAPAVYGDFNGDSVVDGADFVVFGENYALGTVPPAIATADSNGDGLVDGADFVAFGESYAMFNSSSSVAVPEPASVCFVLVGFAVAACRSRN